MEVNIKKRSLFYIYNDLGTCSESIKQISSTLLSLGANVVEVNSADIIGDKLSRNSTFVMPGGRDKCYMSKLSGTGNQILRNLTYNGMN